MPKASLRQTILGRRRHLSAETCLALSLLAQERALALPEFDAARCVALYSPVLNEVFTEALFDAAYRQGRRVVYPRVRARELDFVAVASRDELLPGAFGVLEPPGGEPTPPAAIDLVVVPGVAFDRGGHRLGYGKGFYDRALERLEGRATLVGLGFELQLVDRLPAETHDKRLDLLVTEEQILDFRPQPLDRGLHPRPGLPKQ